MTRLLCLIVVAAACGQPSARAQSPASQPKLETSDAGPRPSVEPRTSDTKASNERCNKLIDHVVTLAVAERPAEQNPTDAERTNIVTQLRTAWSPKCDAMTERGYTCAVAAKTLAALDRCGG